MSCLKDWLQLLGTGNGVWTVVGVVPGMRVIFRGFPFHVWRGWWGHVLNVLGPKYSSIHSSSRSLLFSVRGNVIASGFVGMAILWVHLHWVFLMALVVIFCLDVVSEIWKVIILDLTRLTQISKIRTCYQIHSRIGAFPLSQPLCAQIVHL